LVAGSQFTASLVSRLWAGHFADRRGAKRAVVAGLLVAALAGGLYWLSLQFVGAPRISVTILLLGRGVLGGAESFIITGALSWGLALGGPGNAGKVIAWVGMAMYAAFAIGAPAGTWLFGTHGFLAIAWATIALPLASLVLVASVRSVAPTPHPEPQFARTARAVWMPGLGLALSSVGFGAVTTFVALLFAKNGWAHVWLAFTTFSVVFIVGRLAFGHLPDKLGGARVALGSTVVESAGLVLIWLASSETIALCGVLLSGLGYSLVYPALGVEAIRRAPPKSRALVMGVFTAFLDLALGLASPALGLIASGTQLSTVFLVSAVLVASATLVTARLRPAA
jgi:MFS family permease